MNELPRVTVVIPTYNREQVLIQTINNLLALEHRAAEILVVDQSEQHSASVDASLHSMHENDDIEWIKLTRPSIPNAMNVGALKAANEIVLFVDDDILVDSELVYEHAIEYRDGNIHGVAGQVIQSWESALTPEQGSYRNDDRHDPDAFRFNSSNRTEVKRFSGGNVSFRRQDWMAVGGFDNNFLKVAYRFESEFSDRFISAGKVLMFKPQASLKHLKELSGGTRAYGDHRTTIKPWHSVGRYYYFLVVKNQHRRWWRFISLPFSSCITKFHFSHPWYIPVTLFAEFSGMFMAIILRIRGQRLIQHTIDSRPG